MKEDKELTEKEKKDKKKKKDLKQKRVLEKQKYYDYYDDVKSFSRDNGEW